jgi:hypothetical protein
MKDSNNYFTAALTELNEIVKYMPKYVLQLNEDIECMSRVQLNVAFTFVKIHILIVTINTF